MMANACARSYAYEEDRKHRAAARRRWARIAVGAATLAAGAAAGLAQVMS